MRYELSRAEEHLGDERLHLPRSGDGQRERTQADDGILVYPRRDEHQDGKIDAAAKHIRSAVHNRVAHNESVVRGDVLIDAATPFLIADVRQDPQKRVSCRHWNLVQSW